MDVDECALATGSLGRDDEPQLLAFCVGVLGAGLDVMLESEADAYLLVGSGLILMELLLFTDCDCVVEEVDKFAAAVLMLLFPTRALMYALGLLVTLPLLLITLLLLLLLPVPTEFFCAVEGAMPLGLFTELVAELVAEIVAEIVAATFGGRLALLAFALAAPFVDVSLLPLEHEVKT